MATDVSPVVRFVDLVAQIADVEELIVHRIRDLIRNGAFVGGPAVAEFEKQLATYTGSPYAIGCSDGTSALKLALLGSGLKPGDGVVVPTNSYIASAFGVTHAGGRPIFVDCDEHSFLIDLNQAEDALRAGIARFLMPVHLYGNPCPMDDVMALADKFGAIVIEDNAQAIGASFGGQKTGTFGSAAGISFYPAKNLGAFGQGGAVLTRDEAAARIARMYSEQGQGSQRYYHDVVGDNDRLHTVQASILSVMLSKLDDFNDARRRAAAWYSSKLPSGCLQRPTPDSVHVYHLLEYRCDSRQHRDRLVAALERERIGFGYHYPLPIHKQRAYSECNHVHLPVAERLADTLISLPMHPFLSKDDVMHVCDIVSTTH